MDVLVQLHGCLETALANLQQGFDILRAAAISDATAGQRAHFVCN
jgi:hypothetical protein